MPLRRQEGVGHPAANEHRLAAGEQRIDHLQLAADLCPADDRVERPLGMLEEGGEGLHLALQEEPRHARQKVGDPLGRGVGAVGGTKGVVDVEVRHVGQGLGEARLVGLLFAVEAQVLEEQQVAGTQLVDGHLDSRSECVAGHAHRTPEQC